MCLQYRIRHPAFAQPGEVAQRILTARQDHQINVSQRFRAANIAYAHIRLRRQSVKIRKVRNMWQLHNGNSDITGGVTAIFIVLQRDAIFIFQIHIQPRHHSQDRDAGKRFDLFDTGIE
ncbi:Uncharacterised protein [Salmonella enterica subsp. enterica serovar Bovismorbificans]|nr:Uncharacterised protein [Salmonella enterica subsp. enterica serovar Bovismorbificans]CPR42466.1 Uncharacterised protein [Salmonella enterica subsp. enterica serovar Bovismorbificans]